jgi:hypothetical protein
VNLRGRVCGPTCPLDRNLSLTDLAHARTSVKPRSLRYDAAGSPRPIVADPLRTPGRQPQRGFWVPSPPGPRLGAGGCPPTGGPGSHMPRRGVPNGL